ncbi:MAG: sulfite exporter TauE/SafE family protein [Pseudomonadota bacterium]
MTTLQIAVVAGAFIVAGLAKGAIGMGLPPVALALMSFSVPLADILAMMVVPTIATNVWQAIAGHGLARLGRRFATMAAAAIAALLLVSVVFGTLGTPKATAWVGIILAVYAALALTAWRPRVPRAAERWANPLAGIASGAVAGVTGVAAVPFLPYMQSLDIDRNDLVQALGIMFVAITGALTLALALQGIFTPANVVGGFGALVPTFLGVWIGQHARRAISAETFRRAFLLGMLAIGLQMASRLL